MLLLSRLVEVFNAVDIIDTQHMMFNVQCLTFCLQRERRLTVTELEPTFVPESVHPQKSRCFVPKSAQLSSPACFGMDMMLAITYLCNHNVGVAM